MKKENKLIPAVLNESSAISVPRERQGTFKQGYDKLGRPYEKKRDTEGVFTKEEILKDGTRKLTIKK